MKRDEDSSIVDVGFERLATGDLVAKLYALAREILVHREVEQRPSVMRHVTRRLSLNDRPVLTHTSLHRHSTLSTSDRIIPGDTVKSLRPDKLSTLVRIIQFKIYIRRWEYRCESQGRTYLYCVLLTTYLHRYCLKGRIWYYFCQLKVGQPFELHSDITV